MTLYSYRPKNAEASRGDNLKYDTMMASQLTADLLIMIVTIFSRRMSSVNTPACRMHACAIQHDVGRPGGKADNYWCL